MFIYPRDGERYVVLSQEVDQERRALMEARFKKFLQATRWRRIKSRYKIEVFQEDLEGRLEPPGFETALKQFIGGTFDIALAGSKRRKSWLSKWNPAHYVETSFR
jgi:hypothetical protein